MISLGHLTTGVVGCWTVNLTFNLRYFFASPAPFDFERGRLQVGRGGLCFTHLYVESGEIHNGDVRADSGESHSLSKCESRRNPRYRN